MNPANMLFENTELMASKPLRVVHSVIFNTSCVEDDSLLIVWPKNVDVFLTIDHDSFRLRKGLFILIRSSDFSSLKIENKASLSYHPLPGQFDGRDYCNTSLIRQTAANHFSSLLLNSLHLLCPNLESLLHHLDAKRQAEHHVTEQIQIYLSHLQSHLAERLENIAVRKSLTRLSIFKKVQTAKDYILSNFETIMALKEVGNASSLSASHLLKYYGLVMGITPHQHIISLKLELAKMLLQESKDRLEDVIFKVGFKSTSSFIRLYKARYGITPCEFRAKAQSARDVKAD